MESTVPPIGTVDGVLGVGWVLVTFVAVSTHAVSAFSPTDPMAGAFAGAVFVLLRAVLAFCPFIVRSFSTAAGAFDSIPGTLRVVCHLGGTITGATASHICRYASYVDACSTAVGSDP